MPTQDQHDASLTTSPTNEPTEYPTAEPTPSPTHPVYNRATSTEVLFEFRSSMSIEQCEASARQAVAQSLDLNAENVYVDCHQKTVLAFRRRLHMGINARVALYVTHQMVDTIRKQIGSLAFKVLLQEKLAEMTDIAHMKVTIMPLPLSLAETGWDVEVPSPTWQPHKHTETVVSITRAPEPAATSEGDSSEEGWYDSGDEYSKSTDDDLPLWGSSDWTTWAGSHVENQEVSTAAASQTARSEEIQSDEARQSSHGNHDEIQPKQSVTIFKDEWTDGCNDENLFLCRISTSLPAKILGLVTSAAMGAFYLKKYHMIP